jgi:hypothetical protein
MEGSVTFDLKIVESETRKEVYRAELREWEAKAKIMIGWEMGIKRGDLVQVEDWISPVF